MTQFTDDETKDILERHRKSWPFTPEEEPHLSWLTALGLYETAETRWPLYVVYCPDRQQYGWSWNGGGDDPERVTLP